MSEAYTQLPLFAQTRRCPRCREGKPLDAFGSGQWYCRECARAKKREWTAANAEHIRAYAKMRYDTVDGDARRARRARQHAAFRERDNQYSKAWREKNPERDKANHRDYSRRNKERFNEYARRRRREQPDKVHASDAINRDRNRESRRALQRAYQRAHPEQMAEKQRRRSARKRGYGTFPVVDYIAILERDGMVCHICGQAIGASADLHFDHVIPLAKGGTHTKENIRPAHVRCNLRKGAKLI